MNNRQFFHRTQHLRLPVCLVVLVSGDMTIHQRTTQILLLSINYQSILLHSYMFNVCSYLAGIQLFDMAPRVSSTHRSEDFPADDHGTKLTTSKKSVVFFRIGALRFGVHGVFGIISTIAVLYSLFKSYLGEAIPFWIALSIVITSTVNSVGSYPLLPQVPNSSRIASWIIPPHREAFKRTIAIVGYLNIRLVHEWQWVLGRESLIFPTLLFLYTNYHFFPRHSDYFNGNTWVFVLPMFLGFNVDTFMQFPSIGLRNAIYARSIFMIDLNWDDVHNWNQYRVDETYLLLTLLCALQIAFMFTVAFRGRMSIRACYWIAAAQVGLLCVRLFHA